MATKPKSGRDYVAIANQYARDVIGGTIPACRWVRLACQRHINDLERFVGPDSPWHFDPDKAARPCRFIELLPHIKGRWKTARLFLEPWQIFIVVVVFGWVDAEGFRRFYDVYIEVPRKNAKSTLTSGVALYCLCEGEPGAEVVSAATKKDQARIVFDVARRMVNKTPGLKRRFGVGTDKQHIFIEASASEFRPLSSDEDGLDGLNVHFASVDELHAHKTRAVHDVLDSATGSRRQPLKWRITTAGSNQQGVCYEQREYVCKILDGLHEDDRYFGIVYTIDLDTKDAEGNVIPGDDWRTEEAARKANPNYGVSVLAADISALRRKALQSARSQNNYLIKRLCVWVNAIEAYYNLEAWRTRCVRHEVTLADFEGAECWIGLDLSSKTDIAAKVRLFRRYETDIIKGKEIEQAHYYLFGEYYLPEDILESDENLNYQHYTEWSGAGLLRLTPGAAIDYSTIEDDLREDMRRFDVRGIGFDPWNAEQMRQRLEAEGAPMLQCRMGVQTMSEPMKTTEALVRAGRLHSGDDPVFQWMLSNVVGVEDRKSNVYPRKEKPEKKIDGPVALMMAHGIAIRSEATQEAGIL